VVAGKSRSRASATIWPARLRPERAAREFGPAASATGTPPLRPALAWGVGCVGMRPPNAVPAVVSEELRQRPGLC
jgi:hypothetical protein